LNVVMAFFKTNETINQPIANSSLQINRLQPYASL